MEPQKAPDEVSAGSAMPSAASTPPAQATQPAEATLPQSGSSGPQPDAATANTKAPKPSPATAPAGRQTEPSSKPLGFIFFGAAVLVVLLVLAFIAYSKQQ